MKIRHFGAGLALLVGLMSLPLFSESPYDTALSIIHLDIRLKTDFGKNEVPTSVKATVENFSDKDLDRAEFWICPGMNDPDLGADIQSIRRLGKGSEKPLPYTIRTEADDYNPGYSLEIYAAPFEPPLKPGEKAVLEFQYVMKGKPDHSSTPIWKSPEGLKELFLRGDFFWCPSSYVPIKTGVFPNLYQPSWTLSLDYPAGFVGVADGDLVRREEKAGGIHDEWKSIIGGYPQVFASPYKVVKRSEAGFTLEIYAPEEDLARKGAERFEEFARIFNVLTTLYGPPGSSTYRIVGSPMQQGGNGLVMGQVIAARYLANPQDASVIAHELAHTWWGGSIRSYGQGSKFLREAVGDFSGSWALGQVQGEKAFLAALSRQKRSVFYGYFTRRLPEKQYPLIEQEGYDPEMIIGANYRKGPLVVNQLRLELGNDVFFKCLGTFARTFKNKNVTIQDFIQTFNRVAQRDLTMLFRDLLWSTGYPIYEVKKFSTVRKDGAYVTTVTIGNDGPFGVSCPLALKTQSGETREMFSVPGKSTNDLLFKTAEEVVEIVVDPDKIGFQYDPRQKTELDEESKSRTIDLSKVHPGDNWSHFFAAALAAMKGDYPQAAAILTKYFAYYRKVRNVASVEDMGRDPYDAGYLFTRGIYYLAGGEKEHAELDFKMAVPGLMECLAAKRDVFFEGGWVSTGVLVETGDRQELVSLLNLITGENFSWDDGLDEAAKNRRVAEWKTWWDQEGKHKPLVLEELWGKYRLGAS